MLDPAGDAREQADTRIMDVLQTLSEEETPLPVKRRLSVSLFI
jgi:hypothetical protein